MAISPSLSLLLSHACPCVYDYLNMHVVDWREIEREKDGEGGGERKRERETLIVYMYTCTCTCSSRVVLVFLWCGCVRVVSLLYMDCLKARPRQVAMETEGRWLPL